MTELEKNKIRRGSPCVFPSRNSLGHERLLPAAVDCGLNCEACGWNPAEQERRMRFGFSRAEDGTWRILFKPKKPVEKGGAA